MTASDESGVAPVDTGPAIGDYEPVQVFSSIFPLEAEVARSLLEHHGIAAFVANEETITAHPLWANAVGGAVVVVPFRDAEMAHRITSTVGRDPTSRDARVASLLLAAGFVLPGLPIFLWFLDLLLRVLGF